ncbi:MAG TPA: hypothetical protein DF863_07800 [Gammaproteobacteria bacterium]|nr:hypothetical protein [Gammaproteobacteria bacterium]
MGHCRCFETAVLSLTQETNIDRRDDSVILLVVGNSRQFHQTIEVTSHPDLGERPTPLFTGGC